MKALVLTAPNRFEIQERPVPDLAPDQVLIRVRACGICGSDVHGMDGSTGRRIPPVVMGHEAAGEIVRTGSAVTAWKPGDRVTFDSTVYCGVCAWCRRGQINLCAGRRVLGVSCDDYRQDGAFAEYLAVPERILYRLPNPLPFEQAALTEAVSVAVHAVRRTPLEPGGSAAVIGSGMIGLLVVQALRAAGCGRIIAVDLADDRLEMARRLGASEVLRADAPGLPDEIRALTGGEGADAAFEVVGLTQSLGTAVGSVRKGGSVTLVGNLAPRVELPLQAVVTRELTLIGTCASCGEYPDCLDLIASGRIDVTAFISAVAPLEEAPEWFRRLQAGEPGLMKVVIRP